MGDGSGCRSCVPAKNDKAWTVAAGKCFVAGKCYNNGGFFTNQCQKCDVSKSQTAWTVVTSKCWIANNCYNSGQTSPGIASFTASSTSPSTIRKPAMPLATWSWVAPWQWGWYQCVPGGCAMGAPFRVQPSRIS